MDNIDETIDKAKKAAKKHDLATVSENIHKYARDHDCCYILVLSRTDEEEAVTRSVVERECGDVVFGLAGVADMIAKEYITVGDLGDLLKLGLRRRLLKQLVTDLLEPKKEDEDKDEH